MRRRKPGRELELRPDDDLDGCALDAFRHRPDLVTFDEDIHRLLEEAQEEKEEGDHAV